MEEVNTRDDVQFPLLLHIYIYKMWFHRSAGANGLYLHNTFIDLMTIQSA